MPFAHRHIDNPFIQYFAGIYPISNQNLGLENDILDTFDGFSPKYHGIHNPDEVTAWFQEAGLENIRTFPFVTSVRGQRPLSGS